MENLDILGFEFKVGDVVHHRLRHSSEFHPDKEKKTPLLILERIAQECPGGVQKFYMCRLGTISGNIPITIEPAKLFQFSEIEVEA